MRIYLYCSYAHSQKGFCLTRLEGESLVPQPLSQLSGPMEQAVDRFLSYDSFRILWQEFPGDVRFGFVKDVCGGIFGVRSLRGSIADRSGVANVVLLAEREELPSLQAVAQRILEDLSGFSQALFAKLTIGGKCGYQETGPELRQLFDSLMSHPAEPEQPKRLTLMKELLKFAVYVGSWEEASSRLTPDKGWGRCPEQAQSEQEYAHSGGYRW